MQVKTTTITKKVDIAAVDKSLDSVADKPTTQAIEEQNSYQDRKNELKLLAFQQNLAARKKYAHRLFLMLCVWLGLVLIFLFFQGTGKVPFVDAHFELSEAVLITLITTTTANVAGFFFAVVKYLFPTSVKN